MGTVRWTPEETERRLMAIATHWLGSEPAWTLVEDEQREHPEHGQPPMFSREWQVAGAELRTRGCEGAGNPRDGWGWILNFALKLGEPPVYVEVLGGGWDCVVTDDTAYVRGATPADAARIQAWWRET